MKNIIGLRPLRAGSSALAFLSTFAMTPASADSMAEGAPSSSASLSASTSASLGASSQASNTDGSFATSGQASSAGGFNQAFSRMNKTYHFTENSRPSGQGTAVRPFGSGYDVRMPGYSNAPPSSNFVRGSWMPEFSSFSMTYPPRQKVRRGQEVRPQSSAGRGRRPARMRFYAPTSRKVRLLNAAIQQAM